MYKILVLTGGDPEERGISLATAENVSTNLKEMEHIVDVIDIDGIDLVQYLSSLKEKPDLVFNCLHGTMGEGGYIQSILEMFNLKYTHSGVTSSAAAMNKYLSYMIAQSMGITCPLSHKMSFEDYRRKSYWGPHIVKPINLGSSVNVCYVNSENKKNSLNGYRNQVMIQEYIPE
jgi:D-alanine-D-alanine ligase